MDRHIQEARKGPLRASMLDDLTHYLIEYSLELLDSNDSAVASIFIQILSLATTSPLCP